MPPETRYARKGDTSIAYQVVGEGPIDLILVGGLVSHMGLLWSDPAAGAMHRRLASFSRLILFDKPGTGDSDPVAGPPSIEQRVEDVRVVMDAIGIDSASLMGFSEGGPVAAMFAATYPKRCEALVLLETGARFDWAPDYFPELQAALDRVWEIHLDGAEHWGDGRVMASWAPSATSNPGFWQAAGSAERICASPGMARAVMGAARLADAREALPRISAPTLVVHREDEIIPVELGRHLAEAIDGAKLAIFPGQDHLPWVGAWEPIVDEIETFLTGGRHRAEPDRALATILFTDIVSSTERAADLGDERWRALVERHDEIVRGSSTATGGGQSRRSVMVSSPPSRGPRGRSAAPGRSAPRSGRWGSSCGRAYTPGSANCAGRISPGSRSTSERGSRPSRARARCWHRAPCVNSCSARVSSSRSAGPTC